MRKLIPACVLPLLVCLNVRGEDAVRPGRFVVEPPTLICLGFEWEISGDDNRNASVEVEYREAGSGEWKEAMPLLRIGGEKVGRIAHATTTEYLDYTVPNKFAGSIIDLNPDTPYEVRLTMKDPDGVRGDAVQTVEARTRAEPKAATGGHVLHVYPVDWKGAKQEPAVTGLYQAYYGAGTGDWNVVWGRKVHPGDIILVHAGVYKSDWRSYGDPLSIPFDGTYVLTLKGTPDRPIVIRAAGDGEVIFDGDGCHELFNVMAADYNMFEGLTIRNTDVPFLAGLKDVQGAKGLTIRNCRMENVGVAVMAQYAGSKDFYIADNVILGRHDRFRLKGGMESYNAIKVYGSGHVVCHNAVAYFHDGIDICTHGAPDPGEEAVAIDFYNNDIHVTSDDFIESDGGVHNIRVMRNRGVNSGGSGLSAQPIFGGPVYLIRNVLYNVGIGFKFHSMPAGIIAYHNTVVGPLNLPHPFSNAHFRNNLFLGGQGAFANATSYSSFDYDGYRPSGGKFLWVWPRNGKLREYGLPDPVTPKDGVVYESLADLAQATGQERHGVEVDYDVFENLRPPTSVWAKDSVIYHASDLDFRLKPGGKAVDAGVRLPNVNDDFTGRAPDLGAYELGKPIPVYGPRGWSGGAFYR